MRCHKRPVKSGVQRFLSLVVLFLVFGCSGTLFQQAPVPDAVDVKVTVLFFNDLHGHLKPFEVESDNGRQTVGGIARMAAAVEQIRSENNRRQIRTLLLVAGDILQGTPMSTVFQGEPDIKCLNAMGVDAVAVGNHEFDFGLENFLKLRTLADFPFISANIVRKESRQPLCDSHLTIPLNDSLAITVIGVTTHDLMTTTKHENVAALEALDGVTAVQHIYEQARQAGPVLLLSHSRHQTDRQLAANLPGLAAIIGGHDQILLSPYRKIGSVPVFQAFEKGRFLGRIDFLIDPATRQAKLLHHEYIPITADMDQAPQVAAIVADYDKRLGAQFKEVIGTCETFMDGERDRIRYEETNLGNFLTDIMRENTGVEIALLNAGAIRSSFKKGPVTIEDVFNVVPYANELVVMELTGAQIEQILKRSVRGNRQEEDGGFLQVSGISFDVQNHQATGIRVGACREPIKPDGKYRVVITDFIATGGDGYHLFKELPMTYTRLPLRELIIDTIRARGTITAEKEGRIRRGGTVSR